MASLLVYQVGRGRPDAYDEVTDSRRPRRGKGHKKQYPIEIGQSASEQRGV
jgi:hypothetical protein